MGTIMTHDELLAKIDSKLEFCTCDGWNNNCWADDNKPWIILRAVVALHRPEQEIGGGCDENGEELWVCTHCPDGDGFQDYPCLTIQAIEKELS
jgi:hypothetical protein